MFMVLLKYPDEFIGPPRPKYWNQMRYSRRLVTEAVTASVRASAFIGPLQPLKLRAKSRRKKIAAVRGTLWPSHPLFIGPVMPRGVKEKFWSNRWQSANRTHIRSIQAEYRKKKADRFKERKREFHERQKANPNYVIKVRVSGRIRAAIKECCGKKAARSMDLTGCSVDYLRQHLEAQFQPGMTWANNSLHGWHIDHIIPCAAFDLTDPDHQRMCFHYTNLRPLWGKDNMSKNDKLTPEALSLIVTSQETVETDVLPVYIERAG